MISKIDSQSKSDKILIAMAGQICQLQADVHLALMTWQKLVELEARFENEQGKADKSSIGMPSMELVIRDNCCSTACELKTLYNTIEEKMEALCLPVFKLPVERLDEDYREVFKHHGLSE